MLKIPDNYIDMVLTDPPYGTTACKWDSVIPLNEMWEQVNRIIRPNGAIVMTAAQPFTSILVASNLRGFKHDWIWVKNRGSNFASLKYQPMKEHESVLVFTQNGEKVSYYPLKEERRGSGAKRAKYAFNASNTGKREVYNNIIETRTNQKIEKLRNPSTVQQYNTEVGLHPTQKPVALMAYLIKTYTLEHETVVDFAMGSGTSGVAALNLNRCFIGIELDKKYFNIAKNRIEKVNAPI